MGASVLIVGVSGIVGRSVLRRFEGEPGWDIVGISRRPLDARTSARIVSVDLLDAESCRAQRDAFGDVTHVVYCATFEKPNVIRGWMEADHVETNLAMLRNLLGALPETGPFRHLTLLQGTKAYGAAAGPFKLPAKETDPRSLAPNFYYAQEDFVREAQTGRDWTWTILRPQFVCGFSLGSPMNALNGLAAYVAISRELGLPLRFPGGPARVQEATDARLLAEACLWAATSPRCAGETYNIVNGDCYSWDSLWPRIARAFEMDWGPPAPARLGRIMADKGPVWDGIVERHGLRPYRLQDLVPDWALADNLFGHGTPPVPLLLSGIKARQHGFEACIDTEAMFLDWLEILQREAIVPGPLLPPLPAGGERPPITTI